MALMDEIINIAKALSDSNRIRILLALRKQELCVCRIIEILNLAPSTVSKHIAVLKNAGLVECRKEEKWIYYKLPDSAKRSKNIQSALEWIIGSLSTAPRIIKDSEKLLKILRQSPETICKKRVERKKRQQKKRGIN